MYESFYNLRAKPFRLSPDPGFFFASRGHKRALAYLRYGLSQGEGFVVITGAPGTGKTTLAQILLKEMGQSDVVVAHLTTTQLDADDMLRMVAASFGLRYEGLDKAGLLKTLESFLLARSRERKRALLVVDEAQNLPPKSIEELRMLSNLQVGDKALLQTFLLGQAQFRQMLEHPDLEQLRQRVIANYHLSSLAPDECQSYVENRLHHVGWNGDPHFTEQAYQIIHSYTEGVPRRINMLCDRVLLFGSLEERHEIDEALLRQVTDELQQEISGRPVAPVDSAAQSNDKSDNDDRVRQSRPAEQIPAQEDELQQLQDNPETTDTDAPPAEKIPPERTTAGVEQADTTPNEPEPQMLDRAEPDGSWQRSYPQPDNAENHSNDEIDIRPMEKERFRVIPGGKGTGPTPGETEQAPGVIAPAAQVTAGGVRISTEPEDVVLRKILRLVLAFHRSPRSFPGLDDPTQPLPKGIRQILQLAVSDDQVLLDLRQIAIMGISPAMMRAAVRFFVRRVLFLPGGDDYRALGLSPGAATAEVEVHYGLLMRLMRQEKQQPGEEGGVSRIGEAYERLCRGDAAVAMEAASDRELGDIEDIEDIEELDLDLAPNLGGVGRPGKVAGISALGSEGSKRDSKLILRNVVLVAGAAVIVFVLYLTQIRTTGGPVDQQIATAPVVQPESATSMATEEVEIETGRQSNVAGISPQAAASSVPDTGAMMGAQDETITEIAPSVETPPAASLDDISLSETSVPTSPPAEVVENDSAALMAEEQARQRAEEEAKAREAEAEAKAKARALAEAKQKAEAEAQAAAEARAKAELQARVAAESKARAEREAKAKAEAEAKAAAEAQAKAKAEAQAKAEAAKKAEAEAQAKAEAEEARARAEAQAKAEAEKARVAALEKTTQPSPPLAATATAQIPSQAGANSERVVSSVSGEKAAAKTAVDPAAGDTDAAFNNVIERFKKAYEAGDISSVTALFALNARTNDRTDLAGIRADYQKLFEISDRRQLSFQGLTWKVEAGYVRGMGGYKVLTHVKKGQNTVTSQGSVTLQLEGSGRDLRITRFYFDEHVPEGEGAGKAAAGGTPPGGEALNHLVRDLVSTYEAGNIENFMALFAADAQTNDRSTVAGIREDYISLFRNSVSRKMTLNNFRWDRDGMIARGEGKYTVEIQSPGRPVARYSGSLWIQVENRGEKALITHLAFVE